MNELLGVVVSPLARTMQEEDERVLSARELIRFLGGQGNGTGVVGLPDS